MMQCYHAAYSINSFMREITVLFVKQEKKHDKHKGFDYKTSGSLQREGFIL